MQRPGDGDDAAYVAALAGGVLSRMLTANDACGDEDDEDGEEDGDDDVDGDGAQPAGTRSELLPPRRRPSMALHKDGAVSPEHVMVAPDSGFIIITRGGRTLHHRPQCQCKPCLARRRALRSPGMRAASSSANAATCGWR